MTLSKAPPTLTVSIINFRTGALTLDCVRSVLADLDATGPDATGPDATGPDATGPDATGTNGTGTGRIAAHVVVVDNRSDDGSAETVADWIAAQDPAPPVSLIRSETNSGFSGGHNQAIAAVPAAFTLVLNSDALVRPGFFRALLDAAAANPGAGLFAPRIEYDDGTPQVSCFRLPSPASELIRGAATGPVTRLLARHDVPMEVPPDGTPIASDRIGWASFACILLRGTMIEEIGPMDEGYFLYFEDTEYCLRAGRAGWRIVHVPDARVVHFRGGSGPVKALAAAQSRLPGYFYASRTRFFHQAYGRGGVLAANLSWHLGRGLAQLRRLAGKPVPGAAAHEARDIWTDVAAPLTDRPGRRG